MASGRDGVGPRLHVQQPRKQQGVRMSYGGEGGSPNSAVLSNATLDIVLPQHAWHTYRTDGKLSGWQKLELASLKQMTKSIAAYSSRHHLQLPLEEREVTFIVALCFFRNRLLNTFVTMI
eukprot:TRINITY_DN692_c0_g1_i2.p1 TRINITY_DN692_c0_g1~~TRINITY_DN692_c0_g1_i2.p1  ORF type:complete len:120 (+),score=5.07 TRINITY_DN692_c0_g1_i2:412-771(+)